jgi:hypothetical protein
MDGTPGLRRPSVRRCLPAPRRRAHERGPAAAYRQLCPRTSEAGWRWRGRGRERGRGRGRERGRGRGRERGRGRATQASQRLVRVVLQQRKIERHTAGLQPEGLHLRSVLVGRESPLTPAFAGSGFGVDSRNVDGGSSDLREGMFEARRTKLDASGRQGCVADPPRLRQAGMVPGHDPNSTSEPTCLGTAVHPRFGNGDPPRRWAEWMPNPRRAHWVHSARNGRIRGGLFG